LVWPRRLGNKVETSGATVCSFDVHGVDH